MNKRIRYSDPKRSGHNVYLFLIIIVMVPGWLICFIVIHSHRIVLLYMNDVLIRKSEIPKSWLTLVGTFETRN